MPLRPRSLPKENTTFRPPSFRQEGSKRRWKGDDSSERLPARTAWARGSRAASDLESGVGLRLRLGRTPLRHRRSVAGRRSATLDALPDLRPLVFPWPSPLPHTQTSGSGWSWPLTGSKRPGPAIQEASLPGPAAATGLDTGIVSNQSGPRSWFGLFGEELSPGRQRASCSCFSQHEGELSPRRARARVLPPSH